MTRSYSIRVESFPGSCPPRLAFPSFVADQIANFLTSISLARNEVPHECRSRWLSRDLKSNDSCHWISISCEIRPSMIQTGMSKHKKRLIESVETKQKKKSFGLGTVSLINDYAWRTCSDFSRDQSAHLGLLRLLQTLLHAVQIPSQLASSKA